MTYIIFNYSEGLFIKLMYSYQNSLLLESLMLNTLPLNMQIHTYDTLNANAFHIPLYKTNTRHWQFAIYYQGQVL